MRKILFPLFVCVTVPVWAITVEVAPGESDAVKIAAANLRADLAKVCPNHAQDTRKIVVKTTGKGAWESSVRTYRNGVWTIAGADRRGTVYGIYAVSEELGVSPFYWWDDIPTVELKLENGKCPISEKRLALDPPAVRYRGIFINDEDWCLREWAVKNFERDGTKSIGVKTYEKVFEMMLRARLNVIWPAMHGGGYEFVTRPENLELADRMGIVIGTSHCEPMLRNNVYWDKRTQGEWNYATNKSEIDKYWQWSVDNYGKYEILWTIGIRGTHDAPMSGGASIQDKIGLVESVFDTQTNMLARARRAAASAPAMNFIPYKEVLPIYDAGLKVPKTASIMWVDDNFGYIRRLGGPAASDHTGGMYWHVSYFGGPHSYTHVATTSPGFMWYELGAKCLANNAKETWILNVGDVKPADIQIAAFADIAWNGAKGGPDFQKRFLVRWAKAFLGPTQEKLLPRVVRHMDEYYRLGTVRKPELMAKQWVDRLSETEKVALTAQYLALEAEDVAIEAALDPAWRDAWYSAFGYQARFMARSGCYFLAKDAYAESGKARVQEEIRALTARYDALFGGKWKHFWYDTFPARGWDNTENTWAAQMQWPWKEPKKGRHYNATAGAQGTEFRAWVEASRPTSVSNVTSGGWRSVRGLGVSNTAMALLPVREGAGVGAALDYDLEWTKGDLDKAELVLQFLPDYRLYPGLKLRVGVEVNGGPRQLVEVPYSDGTQDENSWGRDKAVQDNLVRAFVPCANIREGVNRVRITAVDPGVVLDRLCLSEAADAVTTPFDKAQILGRTTKEEYKVGEDVVFTLELADAYRYPAGAYHIRWKLFDDEGKKTEGKAALPLAEPLVLRTSMSRPGYVRLDAVIHDADGKEVKSKTRKNCERIFFFGGIGVEPDRIRSPQPEPKDFDAYWAAQKKRLDAVRPELLACTERPCDNRNTKIYAVKVACAGRRPMTGYLEVPDAAKLKGKVPARVRFRGYGVHDERAPRWGDEQWITLTINAHGCELDQPREYYDRLRREELRTGDRKQYEYGQNPEENRSPDTSYFHDMAWRVLQALRYVKTRPEWDGKTLVVEGGSQGALQATWAAALDPDVTAANVDIPWNCNYSALVKDVGIKPDWGMPYAPGLAYFDAVTMAKRIPKTCPVTIGRAALGDELCPPQGLAMYYNAIRGPKRITWVQGSRHGYVPPPPRQEFTRSGE